MRICTHPLLSVEKETAEIMHTHFRRLERLYGRSAAASTQVAVSFGRALLNSDLEDRFPGATTADQLVNDAARLAASSLNKEHVVTADEFEIEIHEPDYTGPVQAMAQVVLTQPPRSLVTVLLIGNDETVIAEAQGSFTPTERPLPELTDMEAEQVGRSVHTDTATDEAILTPASFMPVFVTPMGMVGLN